MARYPYQWALMQRDKRLSGGSKHAEAKAGAGGPGLLRHSSGQPRAPPRAARLSPKSGDGRGAEAAVTWWISFPGFGEHTLRRRRFGGSARLGVVVRVPNKDARLFNPSVCGVWGLWRELVPLQTKKKVCCPLADVRVKGRPRVTALTPNRFFLCEAQNSCAFTQHK